MTIQWQQTKLPSSYRCSNGCMEIAAVGKKYGRSIAVAASRGFCVLDLSMARDDKMSSSRNKDQCTPSLCGTGFQCTNQGFSSGVGLNHPKWRMFSEAEETSFSVQTMIWWERENAMNGSSEDILLCSVNYIEDDYRQVYLAAWSRRR